MGQAAVAIAPLVELRLVAVVRLASIVVGHDVDSVCRWVENALPESLEGLRGSATLRALVSDTLSATDPPTEEVERVGREWRQ